MPWQSPPAHPDRPRNAPPRPAAPGAPTDARGPADTEQRRLSLRQLHARHRPRRAARGGRHRGRAASQGLRAAAPARRERRPADQQGRDHGRGLARRDRHRGQHHPVRHGDQAGAAGRRAAAAAHRAAARLPVRNGRVARRQGGHPRRGPARRLRRAARSPARSRRRRAAVLPRCRSPHAGGAALQQHDRRPGAGVLRRRRHRRADRRAFAPALVLGDRPELRLHLQGPRGRCAPGRARARRRLRP